MALETAAHSAVPVAARPALRCDLVLLTWNRPDLLRPCVERLLRHTRVPCRLLIVDNASTDPEAQAVLRAMRSSSWVVVEVVRRASNDGFSIGMNDGLARSTAPYVCLLNNDILVTEGWLEELLRVAEANPAIGLLNPMSNEFGIAPGTRETVDDVGRRLAAHAGRWIESWAGVGFCMLIPRRVLEAVGGLDRGFEFMYFEDADYAMRVRRAGFECAIAEAAYVYHHSSATMKKNPAKAAWFQQNETRFFEKWGLARPQRIAWIVGAEEAREPAAVRDEIRRLANAGHKVTVWVPRWAQAAIPRHLNVTIRALPRLWPVPALAWHFLMKKKPYHRVIANDPRMARLVRAPIERGATSRPPEDLATCVAELNRQTSHDAQATPAARTEGLWTALGATLGLWARIVWRQRRAATLTEVRETVAPPASEWLVRMKRWECTAPTPGSRLEAPGSRQMPPASSLQPPARSVGVKSRQRLTILLMTKNEERQIERCLRSVAWADEIVVVDGQSTDRTVELCRQAGATVVSRPFSGSFAEERNAGLDAATGDWMLQMDADETVTPALRLAIERVLTDSASPLQAYRVRRRNVFLGHVMRFGGWYHDHLCLFRRGHRYHGLVHERLNVTGPVGRLAADLRHEPFQSLEQFLARQNRYTTLQANELFETRGPLPWAHLRRTLRRRPLNRWWKFYVKKQGFRDGMHGLLFSTLYAGVEFLVWAKYAELACGEHEHGRG